MGRAPCCDNKDGLKKGPWLPEEDQKLVDFIQEHGPGNWRTLPKKAGLQRCGKSCRLRWTNYLRPDIKRGRFTFEEEEAIIQLHSVLGNKWSAIAAKLPGRTDNEIKNYWNTHIRKRLIRMGLDPVTHTRRFDLLNLPSILNSPLQNSSQINLLKLLSLQSLVNPDLLRLAALLSSNQNQNQHQHQQQNLNFLLQNLQANEIANTSGSMEQNQYNQIAQTSNQAQTAFQNNVPVFGDSLVMQPGLEECMTAFPNFEAHSFGTQTGSLVNDHWQSNVLLNSDSAVQQQQQDDSQYVSNTQVISDFLLNTPDFKSGNSNKNNPSLSSVFSTPCTSQETPLNSNSEYPSSSNEDEIDSYCQSLMNFDIPDDFFNVC